jgi:glucokinase
MSETVNQAARFVGVEVSKTMFIAVCIDANGTLNDNIKVAADGGQNTISQLTNFINETKNRFDSFDKIGVAVPGLLNRQTKRVAFSTNIPEHENLDFASELENSTGLKVIIENDANAAAYGEFSLGAAVGSRDMFYVTLGAGVGGALIFDGEIWHGASGFAGEFGHIAINSEAMRLEDVASAENIVRRTRNRFHQDHTSSLSRFSEEKITLADVAQAARNQDDFAKMMLQRTGTYVGAAIAGVINLLNIETIVIGGETMQAGELILEAVIRRARELSFAPSFRGTKIFAGELGENAAAIGVALLSAR